MLISYAEANLYPIACPLMRLTSGSSWQSAIDLSFYFALFESSKAWSTFPLYYIFVTLLWAIQTISMYMEPPAEEITLDEFELMSLDRLQVLRKIEDLKVRAMKHFVG